MIIIILKLLINIFIKDNENIDNITVRNKYGYLAGIIGIISNLALFIIKFLVGNLTSSIAVVADAFNNLSDMSSSLITIFGFKLASMPADKEHPFGHGRLEYISALMVAFMVMSVGFKYVGSSFNRILNPVSVQFQTISFILLVISIAIKLWLSLLNKNIGEKINSSALKASATDALGDVFTSTGVVISLLVSKFTDIPVDGYVGILVSIGIIYAGYNLVKETISPLIGETPNEELVKNISQTVLSYKEITGIHDLIVHNYGIGKCIASIHAEIPSNIDIMEIHEVIDDAERKVMEELNVHLVIHMDPICVEDEEVNYSRMEVEKIIKYNPLIKSMHDFRVVGAGDKKNLIFDIVVNPEKVNKIMTENELKEQVIKAVKDIHPDYNCIITVDKCFL